MATSVALASEKDGVWFRPSACEEGKTQLAANKRLLRTLLDTTKGMEILSADLPTAAATLCAKLGHAYSKGHIERLLAFSVRLHRQLPKFRAHCRRIGVVCARHFNEMEFVLQGLENPLTDSQWARLDAALVAKFTPQTADQDVPNPARVRRWLTDLIHDWLVAVCGEEETEPDKEENSFFNRVLLCPNPNPGSQLLTAELPELDANLLMQTVEAYAAKRKISTGDALLELVCNRPDGLDVVKQITLIGIGDPNPEDPPMLKWLHGVGRLTSAQQMRLGGVKTKYFNALKVAKQCSNEHDPSQELRATVVLRDVTCRYPGCSCPARKCDIDHVINFEAGGWTTLSNLQCLCREHHNAKTDRRVRAEMNTRGHVTWYRADGTLIATTIPQGPLAGLEGLVGGITTRHSGKTAGNDNAAPPIRDGLGRWGYTIEQKQARIRDRLRRRNEQRVDKSPDLPPPDWL